MMDPTLGWCEDFQVVMKTGSYALAVSRDFKIYVVSSFTQPTDYDDDDDDETKGIYQARYPVRVETTMYHLDRLIDNTIINVSTYNLDAVLKYHSHRIRDCQWDIVFHGI